MWKCSSTICLRVSSRRRASADTSRTAGVSASEASRAAYDPLWSALTTAAGERPAGVDISLSGPVATRLSWRVAAGKLPCARPSWLPKAEYHGIDSPWAWNGRRAASSSPGTTGKPRWLRGRSSALPAGVPCGCQ